MRHEPYCLSIGTLDLSPGAYADLMRSSHAREVAVDPTTPAVWVIDGDPDPDLPVPATLPVIVAWHGHEFGANGPPLADVVLDHDGIDECVTQVETSPLAARSLTLLLRSQPHRAVDAGLIAESTTYSMLQGGPEFATWRSRRPATSIRTETTSVLVERTGDVLSIALNRPHRHNAISAQLRDELVEALKIALIDDEIAYVRVWGEGPSFCSGGDLAEFGGFDDPATAHIARLWHSPARLAHALADRLHVEIHGSTLGGGIELAAFAHHVVADPQVCIGLPELSMGLVPGAGGTVSLPRRIGRQRTAALALCGRSITADTAFAWGLVDAIAPVPRDGSERSVPR